MKRRLSYLTLLLALAGGAGYWYAHRLTQLDTELAHSVATLETQNEQAAQQAIYALNMMKASVEKNRNYPPDVARLHRAEALHQQVTGTLAALDDCAGQLRHLAGWEATSARLRRPGYRLFTGPASPDSQRWQQVRRQLVTCTDSLRQTGPAAGAVAALPEATPSTPAGQALAGLAVVEHQLLRSEARVLARINQQVAYQQHIFELLAMASAESNVVAPGDTYRAELFLASHAPADLRQVMTCNGRPVPVDSPGIGRVRFRAPLRPGWAWWTGTIRISQNGHDATFVVRVPYRVARR